MTDILLTTYPDHKSRNVGDALITASTVSLLRRKWPDFDPVVLFREKSLEGFTKRVRHNVIAPGFSISNGTYPGLYKLFEDLDRIDGFFPLGCSYQHMDASPAAFLDVSIDAATRAFLTAMAAKHGPFPCRDEMIVKRLRHFDVPAIYSGDMALFDAERVGTDPVPVPEVPAVAVSLQHGISYLEQSVELLKAVKKRFPDSRRYVALHSARSPLAAILEARAKQLGFEPLHLFGAAEGLDAYGEIDLHIGYRLHAHIHFIRNRKPSVLMVEDARSFGFSRTPGTAHGCIQASHGRLGDPDEDAVDRAMAFLQTQIERGFAEYEKVFGFVDATYRSVIDPAMDRIVEHLRRSKEVSPASREMADEPPDAPDGEATGGTPADEATPSAQR
ncbi:polysaccharide pyruvyl transferase family protein [Stappia sp. ES.058]|uniref:polysaccharide pyruvyl transferase family protein n=1 Tax=Stappia sp. ES.058 TaxID=1881061 RepID=UPI0012FE3C94|nr:polysaccharide pyruvyl transferase family protein [Stappia sp. ES.058]